MVLLKTSSPEKNSNFCKNFVLEKNDFTWGLEAKEIKMGY
jgi:hypothetical protein